MSNPVRSTHWVVRGNARLIPFTAYRPAYACAKRIDSAAIEVYEHAGKLFDVCGQEVK